MTLTLRRLTILGFCTLALSLTCAPLACSAHAPVTTRPAGSVPEKSVNLLAGATWTYSTDGGRSYVETPPTVAAEKSATFRARAEFDVKGLAGVEVMELAHKMPASVDCQFRLNGAHLPQPLAGMRYETLPGLSPKLVKIGKNVLEAEITWKGPGRQAVGEPARTVQCEVKAQLNAFGPGHLKFDVGPVLGAFGPDTFTVTCRTNMAKAVKLFRLESGKTEVAASPAGFYHRFQVKRDMTRRAPYTLETDAGAAAEFTSPTYPAADKPVRIVMLGDSRTNAKDWEKVVEAVAGQSPALVIHTGDLVGAGKDDSLWPREFYAPAQPMLSTTPFYPVIGNHEWGAPILEPLFWTPSPDGKKSNWSQQVGDVLLVGLDGMLNWSSEGKNYAWLDKTLSDSKAKFIFVSSHYPAFSSGPHGALNNGKPSENTVLQARQCLVPLMIRHKVQAFFCGHDHFYERSNLEGGLVQVITGGGGAPRYQKSKNAEIQNPFMKVFVNRLHYCVIDVQPDKATLKALLPDGEQIDALEFKPRQ